VERLRKALADPQSPQSLSARTRRRRWTLLMETFPDLESMRVLDLGGVVQSWAPAPVMPEKLTMVNLFPQSSDTPAVEAIQGDACKLPSALDGERFDLVFSNSVIEHVGGHDRREGFADSVLSMSDRHWVQTPYRYFPVEPHWVFPGFQFLPLRARAEVTRHWPLGRHTAVLKEAVDASLTVELLDVTGMRHYFPGSEIRHERLFGVTKSLIAVR